MIALSVHIFLSTYLYIFFRFNTYLLIFNILQQKRTVSTIYEHSQRDIFR